MRGEESWIGTGMIVGKRWILSLPVIFPGDNAGHYWVKLGLEDRYDNR